MSQPPSSHGPPATSSRRQPRRWLRVLLILLLLAALPLGWFVFQRVKVHWRLRAAWAEADRTDPGWRYEELQASRSPIPDEENAALQAARAYQHLPAKYAPAFKQHIDPKLSASDRFSQVTNFLQSLDDMPPNRALDARQVAMLDRELAEWPAALAETRKLADYSQGRFPARPGLRIGHSEVHRLRDLALLLNFDARLAAHRGDPLRAVRSCRAAFALARAVGDEPDVMDLLIRQWLIATACSLCERVLGQCVPPPAELAALQRLAHEESQQPMVLQLARAQRAYIYATFRDLESGAIREEHRDAVLRSLAPLQKTAPPAAETTIWQKWQQRMSVDLTRLEAEHLERVNAWVKLARLPTEAQYAAFKEKDGQAADLDWAMLRVAGGAFRCHAQLGVAAAAIAVERYRQEQGRWPQRLHDLNPGYLEAVPLDVYTGQPIRYRRLPDGVVVYSVGADEQDNQGKSRYLPNERGEYPAGLDVAFRLWDEDQRRLR